MSHSTQSIPVRCSPLLTAVVALLAACSASPTSTGNPTGTPASLAIASGDAQFTAPGSALPVHPAVTVKDASGQPVARVTVTFAVDSGGGSLSATSAVSGSDGVATAGVWTLGPAEGRNTLKVTAGSLVPLTIVATAVAAAGSFPTTTIGTGGGSIVVSQPGALNGFKLDIPGGAFGAPLQATVSYSSNAGFPTISGVTPVSPIVTITSATPGYAAKPLTLHIPAVVPPNTFPVIVMFDSASGAREVLTTVKWDSTGATALLGSLSSANLLGTSTSVGGLRRALMGPVAVHFITIGIPMAALMADFDTGFRPGNDDWEFRARPTQVDTINTALGMSATALWYFSAHPSATKLWNRFQEASGVELSDRRGLRWVSEMSNAMEASVAPAIQTALADRLDEGTTADQQQFYTIRAAFALGQGAPQPQMVSLQDAAPSNLYRAFVIVYKAVGQTLFIADPEYPGDATRALTFVAGGAMQPYVSFGNALRNPFSMGLSTLLPLASLSASYPSVVNGTIGASDFFAYHLHSKYGVLGDTIWVPDTLRVWAECAACSPLTSSPSAPEATASLTGIDRWTFKSSGWVSSGSATVLGYNTTSFTAPLVLTDGLVISEQGEIVAGSAFQYWMDWKQIMVVKVADTISTATLTASNGGMPPLTLVQQTKGLLPTHQTYSWDFNDGTAKVTVNDNATVQHTYKLGIYTITGQLLDVTTNQPLASTALVDTVKPLHFVWQLDQVTLASSVPTLANQMDTTIQAAANGLLTNVLQTPGNNLIFATDSTNCSTAAFEHFRPGDAVVTTGLVVGEPTIVAAANCIAGGSFTMGPLGQGGLAGNGPSGSGPALIGGGSASINAIMAGTNLNGTVRWNLPYSGGSGIYTLTFHAVQVP